MRKTSVLRRGTKQAGEMSARAAAAAFLTLPTLSPQIPAELKSYSNYEVELQMLSLFSNCIDITAPSRKLSQVFNPPQTAEAMLCGCLSGWIDRADYRHLGQLDLNVTLFNSDCARHYFDNLYYGHDGKALPLLLIEMGGDQDRQFDVSYLRENPKIGSVILDLLDKSPVFIMTPARLLDAVSWMYWGGNPDETERIEEIKEEQDVDDVEALEDEIASWLPIVHNDFEVAFPDWTMKEPVRTDSLPDVAVRLKQANARYKAVVTKYNFHPQSCDMYILPGISLTGLASEPIHAQGIYSKWWDDTVEDVYNNGGDTHLSAFAMFIDPMGGYNACRETLEIVRAYFDCMDAAVELLCWLESQIKEEIKVTA